MRLVPVGLDIPSTLKDTRTFRLLSLYQFVYSICGLVLGLACVIGGVALFLNGVAGSAHWTAKVLDADTSLSDAAPGAVLFVVGLFVVVATRFTAKITDPPPGRPPA